jgi:hypothetical protein
MICTTRDLVAAGHRLEHAWYGPPPGRAPTILFLHEGLGSVVAFLADLPLWKRT